LAASLARNARNMRAAIVPMVERSSPFPKQISGAPRLSQPPQKAPSTKRFFGF
jgi:hypothetical protein